MAIVKWLRHHVGIEMSPSCKSGRELADFMMDGVILSQVAAQLSMKTGGAAARKNIRPHPSLPGQVCETRQTGTSPFDVGIRAHIHYFVGRFVIEGTCTSPKTGAHVANNINIALQVFREWRDMPTRHLYDVQAVKNGRVDVIVGLAQDIMSTVLRPAASKTGQVDLSKTKSLSNSCNQNLASAQSTLSHPSAPSPHHNVGVPTKEMCTAEMAKSVVITKRTPPLNFLQAKTPPPFNFQQNKHKPVPLITSEQKRAVKIWLHDLGMDSSKLPATRSGCTGGRSPTHILDDPLRNGSLYCKLLLRMGLARKGDLKVGKNAHLHLAKKDTSLKDDAFAFYLFFI